MVTVTVTVNENPGFSLQLPLPLLSLSLPPLPLPLLVLVLSLLPLPLFAWSYAWSKVGFFRGRHEYTKFQRFSFFSKKADKNRRMASSEPQFRISKYAEFRCAVLRARYHREVI